MNQPQPTQLLGPGEHLAGASWGTTFQLQPTQTRRMAEAATRHRPRAWSWFVQSELLVTDGSLQSTILDSYSTVNVKWGNSGALMEVTQAMVGGLAFGTLHGDYCEINVTCLQQISDPVFPLTILQANTKASLAPATATPLVMFGQAPIAKTVQAGATGFLPPQWRRGAAVAVDLAATGKVKIQLAREPVAYITAGQTWNCPANYTGPVSVSCDPLTIAYITVW